MTLLTDEEIKKVLGMNVAFCPHMEDARAIEAAVIKKLQEQEPVATVVDSDSTESVINQAIPVGTELYLHPQLLEAK